MINVSNINGDEYKVIIEHHGSSTTYKYGSMSSLYQAG